MSDLIWDRRPELRKPVMVCAFKGWNDAGEAASAALSFIRGSFDAEDVAQIDPEEYYDFTAVRPTVRLTEGRTREMDWPENQFSVAEVAGAEGDLVMLEGVEPSLRWRRFTDNVIDTARELDVRMVITLGALLADVPHSRPVAITGIGSDSSLVERLGFEPPSYEGPTGIVGVLQHACATAGLTSVSLWASVPHYVAASPNPKVALALVRGFEGIAGPRRRRRRARVGRRGLRAPGERGRGERSGGQGVRRAARERDGRGHRREPARRGEPALGRHDRARLPALPASARARGTAGRVARPALWVALATAGFLATAPAGASAADSPRPGDRFFPLSRAGLPRCPVREVETRSAAWLALGCRGLNRLRVRVVRGPAHGRLGRVSQRLERVRYTPDEGFRGTDRIVVARRRGRRTWRTAVLVHRSGSSRASPPAAAATRSPASVRR